MLSSFFLGNCRISRGQLAAAASASAWGHWWRRLWMKWKWSSDATLASNKGEVFLRHGGCFIVKLRSSFFHQVGFFATHNSSILELENCWKDIVADENWQKTYLWSNQKGLAQQTINSGLGLLLICQFCVSNYISFVWPWITTKPWSPRLREEEGRGWLVWVHDVPVFPFGGIFWFQAWYNRLRWWVAPRF